MQGGRGGRGGGRRSRSALRREPYDRNKFLAANFSFVVSDTADMAAASADADLPLDWDDVLQVHRLACNDCTFEKLASETAYGADLQWSCCATSWTAAWLILQVDMQTTGEVMCPIALGPPVAPQITPCGHVFSFPAIVQHLVRAAEHLACHRHLCVVRQHMLCCKT